MNIWEGRFGKRYHKRNKDYPWQLRKGFWKEFIEKYDITSALELGAGMGFNLASIENYTYVWGVETNLWAIKHKVCKSSIIWMDAYIYLYQHDKPMFDLVFTCGFLCHLPLSNMLRLIDKVDDIVGKYLLFLEYGVPKEISYKYHGKKNAFFKRPYKEIMKYLYPKYKLVDIFKLTKQQGFDDLDGYLFYKRGEEIAISNNTSEDGK